MTCDLMNFPAQYAIGKAEPIPPDCPDPGHPRYHMDLAMPVDHLLYVQLEMDAAASHLAEAARISKTDQFGFEDEALALATLIHRLSTRVTMQRTPIAAFSSNPET